jgi:HD-GYP domain-containing protein (c-di-GMP phosphodiesterase class II)
VQALKEASSGGVGAGPPQGLEGEQIALPARAAADAARFDALGGIEAVVDALRRRSGGILDPAVVDTLTANADELLADSRAGDPRERLLEVD